MKVRLTLEVPEIVAKFLSKASQMILFCRTQEGDEQP
jgi:hypothetical protein